MPVLGAVCECTLAGGVAERPMISHVHFPWCMLVSTVELVGSALEVLVNVLIAAFQAFKPFNAVLAVDVRVVTTH